MEHSSEFPDVSGGGEEVYRSKITLVRSAAHVVKHSYHSTLRSDQFLRISRSNFKPNAKFVSPINKQNSEPKPNFAEPGYMKTLPGANTAGP